MLLCCMLCCAACCCQCHTCCCQCHTCCCQCHTCCCQCHTCCCVCTYRSSSISTCCLLGILDISEALTQDKTFETGGTTIHGRWSYGSSTIIGTQLMSYRTGNIPGQLFISVLEHMYNLIYVLQDKLYLIGQMTLLVISVL